MIAINENVSAIKSLVNVIELRDSYTQGHSHRVAIYASKIAQALGLEGKRIYLAGLLHDIGKVGLPDAILLKPGKLTREEYEIVKLHTVISEEIVNNMGGLDDLAKIVRHHHEQPCGKGYPDGLVREQIPLAARILSVADVFDSLHSERVYRKSLSLDMIQIIMLEEADNGKLDEEITPLGIKILCQIGSIATPKQFAFPELEKKRKSFFFQDKLTGLGNREALMLLLNQASLTNTPATLLHIDIVNFRHYNKIHGLIAGDELLQNIAGRLAQLTTTKWSLELVENTIYIYRTVADLFYLFYIGYSTDYVLSKMTKVINAIEQEYAIQFETMVIFEHTKLPPRIEFEIGYLL